MRDIKKPKKRETYIISQMSNQLQWNTWDGQSLSFRKYTQDANANKMALDVELKCFVAIIIWYT